MALISRGQLSPEVAARIPPGQQLTVKWPVLHYGSIPDVDLATWNFTLTGLVEKPVQLTWDEFQALPHTTRFNDIHCVTRWSKLDNTWEGIAVRDVLARVNVKPEATHVLIHAEHGFTANLALSDFDREDNLFAFRHDGMELSPEHGWPIRLVVPHLYFWKSVKWVRGLEFLSNDVPGFWEQNGYHMRGDPWAEERYSTWW
ncbi:MAG: sulfite oxidase-like oxidoreductase [Chloroflexi bacterium]|jgi:DMSO/TMAO reductase YedYZ molybdopterin-dependent catalytic subunit|nr:sulfite oxidase-like oxidoreductase [Chloroflexota bacterium]